MSASDPRSMTGRKCFEGGVDGRLDPLPGPPLGIRSQDAGEVRCAPLTRILLIRLDKLQSISYIAAPMSKSIAPPLRI